MTEDLKFLSDPLLFGRQVVDLNASNNVPVRTYVWSLDLSETLEGAGGLGGLLWITLHTASGSAAGTDFSIYDANGNVLGLTSATNGTETARYEYGLFGEPIRATGPAAALNSFRFSTKRTDPTTDLVLYEYRVYQAHTGRWPNRDPLGEPGLTLLHQRRNTQWELASNPYACAENNPIIVIDPDGLESVFIRLETEIRAPDPEPGTKTWHYVEINEYGTILSQQSFIGITEIPFPIQGSGTMGAMVSGRHPTFTVKVTGSTVSAYVYPGSVALGLGPGIMASQLQIDYDIPVSINVCSRTGTVGGSHDGYPSYMVFVKSKKVYDFKQTTATVGPVKCGILKLLPPMDVAPSVSFYW